VVAKHDWDLIERLKYDDGLTWREVAQTVNAGVSGDSLAKQYSDRRAYQRRGVVSGGTRQPADGSTPSLGDFVRQNRLDVKRASCPICAHLDLDVRRQLADASTQGITRKEQIAWLEAVHHNRVTTHQLSAHFQGRHDDD